MKSTKIVQQPSSPVELSCSMSTGKRKFVSVPPQQQPKIRLNIPTNIQGVTQDDVNRPSEDKSQLDSTDFNDSDPESQLVKSLLRQLCDALRKMSYVRASAHCLIIFMQIAKTVGSVGIADQGILPPNTSQPSPVKTPKKSRSISPNNIPNPTQRHLFNDTNSDKQKDSLADSLEDESITWIDQQV